MRSRRSRPSRIRHAAAAERRPSLETFQIVREIGGEGQNRTVDTTIFSRMLYQLSYLATPKGRPRSYRLHAPEGKLLDYTRRAPGGSVDSSPAAPRTARTTSSRSYGLPRISWMSVAPRLSSSARFAFVLVSTNARPFMRGADFKCFTNRQLRS